MNGGICGPGTCSFKKKGRGEGEGEGEGVESMSGEGKQTTKCDDEGGLQCTGGYMVSS
jgi:hypothetical protein